MQTLLRFMVIAMLFVNGLILSGCGDGKKGCDFDGDCADNQFCSDDNECVE